MYKLKINFEKWICLFLYEGVIIQCISLYYIVCVERVISDLFTLSGQFIKSYVFLV